MDKQIGLIRTRSRKEMLFARQMIVNAASAYGLQSLDLVSCTIFITKKRRMGENKECGIHTRARRYDDRAPTSVYTYMQCTRASFYTQAPPLLLISNRYVWISRILKCSRMNAKKVANLASVVNKLSTQRRLILSKRCFCLIQKVRSPIINEENSLTSLTLSIMIDLERAVKILQGFEHYTAKGVGAFQLDGKM